MKPTLLFVYDQRDPNWKDGFWAAVGLLEADYDVTWANVLDKSLPNETEDYDALLVRGDWGGVADQAGRVFKAKKKTFYVCGNAKAPVDPEYYDVIFYENYLQLAQLTQVGIPADRLIHAFGINTEINHPIEVPKMIDYLSVGAFALWKRQDKMIEKSGVRLVVGEVQRDNLPESMAIVQNLVQNGVGVLPQVSPETLALLYNSAKVVYIPADIYGGGERAVQEARACGVKVEIEKDNPKLYDFLTDDIYSEQYMYSQFKKGLA